MTIHVKKLLVATLGKGTTNLLSKQNQVFQAIDCKREHGARERHMAFEINWILNIILVLAGKRSVI